MNLMVDDPEILINELSWEVFRYWSGYMKVAINIKPCYSIKEEYIQVLEVINDQYKNEN